MVLKKKTEEDVDVMDKRFNPCGCTLYRRYVEEQIQGKIQSDPEIVLRRPTTPICDLKRKVISDVCRLLKQLECGIQPDLELILQEISLIEINTYEDWTPN